MTLEKLKEQLSFLGEKHKVATEDWALLLAEQQAYEAIVQFCATNNIKVDGYDFSELAKFEDDEDGHHWQGKVVELHRQYFFGVRSEPPILDEVFNFFECKFYKEEELREAWR